MTADKNFKNNIIKKEQDTFSSYPHFEEASDNIPNAYFAIRSEDKQAFIDYLLKSKVTVHAATPLFTGSNEFLMLEVQTGIPPANGHTLVKQFKPQGK